MTTKPFPQIAPLGRVVFVGAHPDDETFTAAGILAAAAANGQMVACVTATRGEAGVQDPKRWSPARLAKIREYEHHEALRILGVSDQTWLGYPDGRCSDVSDEVAGRALREVLARLRPDTVLTFGPEGLTGHDDHRAVARWVTQAAGSAQIYQAVCTPGQYRQLRRADERHNLFFAIEEPPLVERAACDIYFELPVELIELKRVAMEAMPSQYEALMPDLVPDGVLGGGLSVECFVRGGGV